MFTNLAIVWGPHIVPSRNLRKKLLKWPIEIVDLPISKMVIFHSDVKLPEGMLVYNYNDYRLWMFIGKLNNMSYKYNI